MMRGGREETDQDIVVCDHNGLPICLSKSTWEHIGQMHSEVVGHRDAVEAALQDPDTVLQDTRDRKRRVYVQERPVATDVYAGKLLLVYVKIVRESSLFGWLFRRVGYVATAHFARKRKAERGLLSGKWRVIYQKRETTRQ